MTRSQQSTGFNPGRINPAPHLAIYPSLGRGPGRIALKTSRNICQASGWGQFLWAPFSFLQPSRSSLITALTVSPCITWGRGGRAESTCTKTHCLPLKAWREEDSHCEKDLRMPALSKTADVLQSPETHHNTPFLFHFPQDL